MAAIFNPQIFNPAIFNAGSSAPTVLIPRDAIAVLATPVRPSALVTVPRPSAVVTVPATPTAEVE